MEFSKWVRRHHVTNESGRPAHPYTSPDSVFPPQPIFSYSVSGLSGGDSCADY